MAICIETYNLIAKFFYLKFNAVLNYVWFIKMKNIEGLIDITLLRTKKQCNFLIHRTDFYTFLKYKTTYHK